MVKPSTPCKSLFGRRLREARLRAGIAQDKLGVMIGLDEGCSSARISRYEGGIHEPPLLIGQLLAKALHLPAAYFYTEDDSLAELLSIYGKLKLPERKAILKTAEALLNRPPSSSRNAKRSKGPKDSRPRGGDEGCGDRKAGISPE
jgi:transcriptional regulator with XRE-family HTH domain